MELFMTFAKYLLSDFTYEILDFKLSLNDCDTGHYILIYRKATLKTRIYIQG